MPGRGIAPGTRWEDLPEDWVCPLCGAPKAEFHPLTDAPAAAAKPSAPKPQTASDTRDDGDYRALNALEKSALCSNLARGCEKQYKAREAALYRELADWFKAAAPAEEGGFDALFALSRPTLPPAFPRPRRSHRRRRPGALRALVWDEKVTRILRSLLTRYRDGAPPEGVSVFVCTICGFVFVGDAPPEICPVCKVPGWKFEKVEGR